MGKWKPASPEWVSAFEEARAKFPEGEPRKMFGYDAVFLGGNMVAGLHEAGLVLRLPEEDRKKLVAEGGEPFMPMPGRAMREYVVAPEKLAKDKRGLVRWLKRSLDYVGTMPPKEKKPRKKKAAR